MILFRADGNPKTGTGHIMRCLSLADAFREQGTDSVFIIAEPYMRRLIQQRGYECIVLDTAYSHMEEELPVLLPLLRTPRPNCLILDSYFVTPDYMRAVKAEVPLVYIDDQNTFDYPADIVVNYNLYAEQTPYPPSKIYLLGPQYAPLRKQFQNLAPRVSRETAEHILVSTGGTDQYHIALRCVEYLREHPAPGITWHFVLGSMNQDAGLIKKSADTMPCIVPHQQVSDMSALMLQCDAAVSAAGTTLYELCACGLPTVTYILADNQIEGAAAFERVHLMPCAGDVRNDSAFVEHIFEKLRRLTGDWNARTQAACQMQQLVDGKGAERLARELLNLLD